MFSLRYLHEVRAVLDAHMMMHEYMLIQSILLAAPEAASRELNPRLQEVSSSTKKRNNLSSTHSGSGISSLLSRGARRTRSSSRGIACSDTSSTGNSLSGSSGRFSDAGGAVPVVAMGLAGAGCGLVVVVILVFIMAVG
jgi:hypothetical protein